MANKGNQLHLATANCKKVLYSEPRRLYSLNDYHVSTSLAWGLWTRWIVPPMILQWYSCNNTHRYGNEVRFGAIGREINPKIRTTLGSPATNNTDADLLATVMSHTSQLKFSADGISQILAYPSGILTFFSVFLSIGKLLLMISPGCELCRIPKIRTTYHNGNILFQHHLFSIVIFTVGNLLLLSLLKYTFNLNGSPWTIILFILVSIIEVIIVCTITTSSSSGLIVAPSHTTSIINWATTKKMQMKPGPKTATGMSNSSGY